MLIDTKFFIFLAVIIVTRISLFLRPKGSPTILNIRLHHYMYGIALIGFSAIFNFPILYPIGLGLFVDELPFLILRGKNHKDNYSVGSLLGLGICILLVCMFKRTFFSII
jgi:hypothetical protein